jgi:hypothetical protein
MGRHGGNEDGVPELPMENAYSEKAQGGEDINHYYEPVD